MRGRSLEVELKVRTMRGKIVKKRNGRLQCLACAHRCKIQEGKSGICNVRFNQDGELRVPGGYIAAFQCDPIEKKPFYHAYPNANALSFGMLGCDLHCSYCQNWVTSQSLRDDMAGVTPREISAKDIVNTAIHLGAKAVVSTYNEPLITAEWSVEIFKEAKKQGLVTGFVSNGNATAEVLDYIRPYTDLYKVDLKSFNDRNYRKLGARLDKILEGIREIHHRGFWLEIVTLLIPGFNDDPEEINALTQFISELDGNIPWHVTAFHPDYKMQDPRRTSAEDLVKAAEIGGENGLNYIYAGNLPGQVGRWGHTWCHNCDFQLIKRFGFRIDQYEITDTGSCPECRVSIPGIWKFSDRSDSRIRLL